MAAAWGEGARHPAGRRWLVFPVEGWDEDYAHREIVEFDIHRGDVSVCNFGASPTTSASLRGLSIAMENLSARRKLSNGEWQMVGKSLQLSEKALRKFRARMRPGLPGDTARAFLHAKVLQRRIK